MTFKSLVRGKKIVYVPIYSMFSHETGMIDLMCDGNVNRWLTNFYKVSGTWKALNILGPRIELCKNYDSFKDALQRIDPKYGETVWIEDGECLKMAKPGKGAVFYSQCSAIKTNAGYQRSKEFADEIIERIVYPATPKKKPADLIIGEGQQFILKVLEKRNSGEYAGKIAFWCPVCATNKKTRTFLDADKEINEKLFKEVDFILIATKDQKRYLKECEVDMKKVILVPQFIDRSLGLFPYQKDEEVLKMFANGEKAIYLPFRLSDEGYKIWEIIKIINRTKFNGKVYAPNLNDTNLAELCNLCHKNCKGLSDRKIKKFFEGIQYIKSDRSTYYTVIDNCENVIIPYFEDYNFVMHAAVDELIRDSNIKCKVVQKKAAFAKELV